MIHFALPGPLDQRTGGYIYDRFIVDGMIASGRDVDVWSLPGTAPEADDRAVDGAERLLATMGRDDILVVDGLALDAVGRVVASGAATLPARSVALLHHPLCRETGIDPALAARFEAMERAILPRFARVIVTSPFTRDEAESLGVAADRIAVVLPGTPRAPRARGRGGNDSGEPVRMVSVATITRRKGHEDLIAALARLDRRDWHLTCCGSTERDPGTVDRVRAAIEDAGLSDHVTLTGELDEEALDQHLGSADLFVLASHYEGYGMVLADALVRGLPVVTTTGGAIPETVPNEAGLFVAPGDVPALTGALERAIGDRDSRRRLGDAAFAAGQRVPDWPDSVARFGALLDRLTQD